MTNRANKDEVDRLLRELAKSEGANRFKKSAALAKSSGDRDSDDDDRGEFDDDDEQLNIEALDAMVNQDDKMNWFVNEFGVNIDIPAFYV